MADRLIETVKNEPKPVITEPKPVINIAHIAINEKEDVFINAPTSPTKKSQSSAKKERPEEERALGELKEKLEREQSTINGLKYEQAATLGSDCVYPVSIVYLIVLLAFLGGATANWIVV